MQCSTVVEKQIVCLSHDLSETGRAVGSVGKIISSEFPLFLVEMIYLDISETGRAVGSK